VKYNQKFRFFLTFGIFLMYRNFQITIAPIEPSFPSLAGEFRNLEMKTVSAFYGVLDFPLRRPVAFRTTVAKRGDCF